MAVTTLDALAAMFDVRPIDWWRFVPCSTCNSKRQEPCRKGGDSWPEVANQTHIARIRAGLLLHGTLWLIANGHAADVLGEATA